MTSIQLISFLRQPLIREAVNFKSISRDYGVPYSILMQSISEASNRSLPEQYVPLIDKALSEHPIFCTAYENYKANIKASE